jgi:hypothetical protein
VSKITPKIRGIIGIEPKNRNEIRVTNPFLIGF